MVVVVVEAQAIGAHTQIIILAIIQVATNTLNTRRVSEAPQTTMATIRSAIHRQDLHTV